MKMCRECHSVRKRTEKNMNVVKTAAIVFVVVIGAALIVASVGAQSPSAVPTTNARVGSIPEKPPQFWTADGGTQGQWTALREHCRTVFSDVAAIQKMSPEQIKAVTPVPYSEYENCRMISGAFSGAAQPSAAGGPAPAPSGAATPTPMNTPLPPGASGWPSVPGTGYVRSSYDRTVVRDRAGDRLLTRARR